MRSTLTGGGRFVLFLLVAFTCLSCFEEEEVLVEVATQSLTVDCQGVAGNYGTLDYVLFQFTLQSGRRIEGAAAPQGGPADLDCVGDGSVSMTPITIGPIGGLPREPALLTVQYMGTGPCDSSGGTYEVLQRTVTSCDLTQPPPVQCSLATVLLTCATM